MKLDDNQARFAPSFKYERKAFFSKEGHEVQIDADIWRLNKDVSLYFKFLDDLSSVDIQSSFRQVLSVYAETCSAAHAKNLLKTFKSYIEFDSKAELFSPESIISFRSHMVGREWQVSVLRGFMRSWVSLGYEGVPRETLAMMEKWSIKGNEKGFAVQTMCPEDGPLTDIEMSGIVSAVLESYARGSADLLETSYALILAMTGRRPVQITALKIKDLLTISGKYFINMPRGKQRYALWRGSFKRIAIVEDLWILLMQQAESVKEHFKFMISDEVPSHLVPELPLFPNLGKAVTLENLESSLDGDILHAPSANVGKVMGGLKHKININSERTGSPIHLNPTRFRYTLGTNLAREGKGELIIAEALDHTDTQNAGVYVRNIPEIVERIDKAVALRLAPIAQAFQGVLVKNESLAKRGGDRASRICSAGGNVGSCGSYGFCNALAPVACYTCMYFEPWLDGPHELVLDELISERDIVLDSTGDLKIASVNDRLILAVSDVVARCKAMQSEQQDD